MTAELSIPTKGKISIGRWLGESWELVMYDFSDYFLATVIYLCIVVTVSSVAPWGIFLVWGPLNVGFFHLVFTRMRGEEIKVDHLMEGFHYIIPSMLAHAAMTILIGLGMIFFILPGLVIMAMYLFVYPLILERDMDFWTAMKTSRKILSGYLLEMTLFIVLQGVILLLGALFFGIGLLIAIPWIYISIACAYREGLKFSEHLPPM